MRRRRVVFEQCPVNSSRFVEGAELQQERRRLQPRRYCRGLDRQRAHTIAVRASRGVHPFQCPYHGLDDFLLHLPGPMVIRKLLARDWESDRGNGCKNERCPDVVDTSGDRCEYDCHRSGENLAEPLVEYVLEPRREKWMAKTLVLIYRENALVYDPVRCDSHQRRDNQSR